MIERFKLILEQLKLTPSEFADRIGVQRSSISHVMSGRNKPGIEFLEKILNAFPEIDAAWLITGRGNLSNQNHYDNNIVEPDPLKEETTPESTPKKTKTPLPTGEEVVDKIIIVFKNNTFRILNHP